jgi:hypothetical protein
MNLLRKEICPRWGSKLEIENGASRTRTSVRHRKTRHSAGNQLSDDYRGKLNSQSPSQIVATGKLGHNK